MGAFSRPWKDLDNTKPGEVYLVGDDGWGWFGLAIVASLPVLFIDTFLKETANIIVANPIISVCIYFLIVAMIGAISYYRRTGSACFWEHWLRWLLLFHLR